MLETETMLMRIARAIRRAQALVWVVSGASLALGQVTPDPYRGLWVGQVTLRYVNEVSVPLDENNVAVAPNPDVPTPTADAANLRLIVHVNGAGQVSLLRDVAILNRKGGGNARAGGQPINLVTNLAALSEAQARAESDNDLALVSDERLYGEFPPQPAVRIASAVFDFGDSQATRAVDEVLAAAVLGAKLSVATNGTAAAAQTNALAYAAKVVAHADAAEEFSRFLADHFNSGVVDGIAAGGSTNAAWAAARYLNTNSFYADTRAEKLVSNVVIVIGQPGTATQKSQRAQDLTASYADVGNLYQRFIAGVLFGNMITASAQVAADEVSTNTAPTEATLRALVDGNTNVIAARTEALRVKVAQYRDTRSTNAVESVLTAVVTNALAAVTTPRPPAAQIESDALAAGRSALASAVSRYPTSPLIPTPDYTALVRSNLFRGSAEVAAAAAATGAASERASNSLWTDSSLAAAATVAAAAALRDLYSAAARAARTELPLTGTFGPGQGDARLTWDIVNGTDAPPLAAGALSGSILLPASAPTNPFRHRRHPDHVIGFDIERRIRLDFDGSAAGPLPHAGFGVDRITGVYREEIFGLHKPLGPQKNKGLKVEGQFELNRVSLIDTLNAR